MARPRAPKPAAGPLTVRIRARPVAERASERAGILAEAGVPPTWQETRGSIAYTLSLPDGARVSRRRLFVPRVTCVPPPPVSLDPSGYFFVNPPIQVPDGTEREETSAVTGEPVLAANFKEDPLEALRQIVADVVLRDV